MDSQVKVKPELKIIREEKIPHLLVPGEMGAVLELLVKDKDGKVTDHRVMRSKSFVRQFLELLWIQAFQIASIAPYSVRDTGNTLQAICQGAYTFACNALADDETLGIIVGVGTTAPDIDDYKIETIINTGGVGGQLNYGGVTYGAPASDATTSQFTITRDFSNASGAEITVNEIALYVKAHKYDTDYYFMIIRDVIGGGVAVPNGQTLTVNYREQAVI
ncbi:hypothetical protein ES703_23079 [subsurface metagenome]